MQALDQQLTKHQLVPILDRFLIETDFCDCDAKTLLIWGLWLERQIPCPEQFKRVVWERQLLDRIFSMTILEIKGE